MQPLQWRVGSLDPLAQRRIGPLDPLAQRRETLCYSLWMISRLFCVRVMALLLAMHATATPAGSQLPDTARTVRDSGRAGSDRTVREHLFGTDTILELSITTDLARLVRDRDSTARRELAATLSYVSGSGQPLTAVSRLRARGHWRRQARNCGFPPVLIRIGKAKGTIFADRARLKLVTHCQQSGDYEQYVLREYLVYRMYNLLTPHSYRARLARITYRDTVTKGTIVRHGILVEDPSDLAQRNHLSVLEQKGGVYDNIDPDAMSLAAAFEYMIGNTDWSVSGLHNITLLRDSVNLPIAVPYDFDFSGIVATRYATPPPQLHIRSVSERLYRGNCRSEAEWAPILARFNERRADIYALWSSLPALDGRDASRARSYLDGFYRVINDSRTVRRALIDACLPGA